MEAPPALICPFGPSFPWSQPDSQLVHRVVPRAFRSQGLPPAQGSGLLASLGHKFHEQAGELRNTEVTWASCEGRPPSHRPGFQKLLLSHFPNSTTTSASRTVGREWGSGRVCSVTNPGPQARK